MGCCPIITIGEMQRHIINNIRATERYGLKTLPVCSLGASGIGKTEGVNQVVPILENEFTDGDWGFVTLKLGCMSASDIQGIPVPEDLKDKVRDANGTYTTQTVKILKWVKDTLLPGILPSTPKYGILFLDEFPQITDPTVKNLTYQILLEGKFNDYTMPTHWHVVVAGNREQDGGVYERPSGPVRDRMSNFIVRCDVPEWIAWARRSKLHPIVPTFVQLGSTNGSNILHTYDKDAELDYEPDDQSKDTNYIFATPRSYFFASEKIYAFEKALIDYPKDVFINDLDKALQSLLGDQLGNELFQRYKVLKDVNLNGILNATWINGVCDVDLDSIRLTPELLTYLTNKAYKPADDNLHNSMQILLLLLYKQSKSQCDPSNIKLLLNSYEDAQKEDLKAYIMSCGCIGLYNNLNTRLNEIENSIL